MYSAMSELVEVRCAASGGRAPSSDAALEVEQRAAVPVVRAALGDGVDDAAGRAAELRRVAARLDLDFFDEVGDHVLARDAALEVRRLDAVDDEAVLAGAGAVDREAAELRLPGWRRAPA